MKWIGKRNKFHDGELRTLKRFVLFPTQMENYEWVWLESYFEDQEFWIPWLHGVVHYMIWPQFTTLRKYK